MMIDSKVEMAPQRAASTASGPPGYSTAVPFAVAPPPVIPQPPLQQPVPTAAEVGERYRAELYARCAQGQHEPTVKYGVFGIIIAVVCFPIGLICLFADRDEICSRCGVKLP